MFQHYNDIPAYIMYLTTLIFKNCVFFLGAGVKDDCSHKKFLDQVIYMK